MSADSTPPVKGGIKAQISRIRKMSRPEVEEFLARGSYGNVELQYALQRLAGLEHGKTTSVFWVACVGATAAIVAAVFSYLAWQYPKVNGPAALPPSAQGAENTTPAPAPALTPKPLSPITNSFATPISLQYSSPSPSPAAASATPKK